MLTDTRFVIVNEGVNSYVIQNKNGPKRNIRIPKKVTKNMAFISGVVVGDGHLEKKRGVYRVFIQMTEKKILDIVLKKLFEDFMIPLKIKTVKKRENRKQTYKISFQSKVVWGLLTKVFEIPYGRKSSTVRVPVFVSNNKGFQRDFLTGLFLADGGTNGKSIIFCSISKFLSEDVTEMLRGMGIESKTGIFLNKRFGRVFYESYIRGISRERFKLLFPETSIKFAGVA